MEAEQSDQRGERKIERDFLGAKCREDRVVARSNAAHFCLRNENWLPDLAMDLSVFLAPSLHPLHMCIITHCLALTLL